MFCNRCGKTVGPEAERCPHCNQLLGESRLNGHTAVQPRVLPSDQEVENVGRYAPHTKTTYTAEMDVGEDVYSRTAYRPVLVEEQPQEETQPEEAAQEEVAQPEEALAPQSEEQPVVSEEATQPESASAQPLQLDEAQKAALEKLEAVPEDAPAIEEAQRILFEETGIQATPLKPIKKTGISPEVQNYIQQMEAMRGKKSSRRKARLQEEEESAAQESLAASLSQSAYDEGDEDAEEYEEEAPRRVRRPASPGRIKRWIGRIVAAVLILCVIAGGLFYLAYITQSRSPVEGVSADLFDQGVALMKDRMGADYRRQIAAIYQSPTMAQDLDAQAQKDRDQINALMPQRPMDNDQVFIDTLLSIQEAVDTATATDALALMTQGDSSQTFADDAAQQWAIIENYVLRLESATRPQDLKLVSTGVQDVMATPAPTPAPAADEYQTLSRGSKGPAVKELQRRLRELGWFMGNVDGQYGTVTRRAVQYLQEAAGLETNGIADGELQKLIFSDEAPVKSADDSGAAPTPAPDAAADQTASQQ